MLRNARNRILLQQQNNKKIRNRKTLQLKADYVHKIKLKRKSYLYNLLQTDTINVNSRHNYHIQENKNYTTEALCDKIIEAINSISFEMPDWLGGERVGFNLKTINEITLPRLPMLASGTVVPANFGEFGAILGDNKREPEIVSPLSTIKQAVAEVVGSGGETVIYLILDGKEIYKTVVKENKANTIKTGVNALAE